MAYLNAFSGRAERSVPTRRTADHRVIGPAGPRGGRLPGEGKRQRRTDAGDAEFLIASAVLGLARGLHRHSLIGAQGFRVALALAEHFSARGIAKWRAARRSAAGKGSSRA